MEKNSQTVAHITDNREVKLAYHNAPANHQNDKGRGNQLMGQR